MISNKDIYDHIILSEKALTNTIKSAVHTLKAEIESRDMQQTIESQQRIIEQLTNILAHRYEHGFLFADEPGQETLIIKDGKILSNDKMASISFNWDADAAPTVNIEYAV